MDGETLSPAEVRSLQAFSRSRRTPPYLARRAEIVLEQHRAGVSRRTSAKWFRRFRASGLAGLADEPRTGRPPEPAGPAILTAPLFMDEPGWTTRSVATATGVTQSAVARTWRKVFAEGRTDVGDLVPRHGLEPAGWWSGRAGSVLALRAAYGRAAPGGGMRSPLRPALQTLLATDLIAFRARRDLVVRPVPGLFYVCTSADLGVTPAAVVGRDQWQGLLLDLLPRMTPAAASSLTAAQRAAVEWAAAPERPFAWAAEPVARPSSARPPVPLATTELVARSIISALQHDIVAGRLIGGDRITETHLARAAHASPGQVREALKVLASRGIVELLPNRGAAIPRPGVDDVVETYAARRALGALVVRRAAEAPRRLPDLERALETLLAVARTGDAWATGEADLSLQDVIAEVSGMRRVPAMFAGLTAQLRLFIAVLGFRYTYSVSAMRDDDEALVRLIRERRPAAAVDRWHQKMDDASTYMLRQLNPARRLPR